MAVGNILVRNTPPGLTRVSGSDQNYDQYNVVYGTIASGPLTGTTPDTQHYDTWWQINWDAGLNGWSAQSVITNALLSGDVSKPDFTAGYYTKSNIFWQSGNAPASTSPAAPKLGSALGNCTWYASGRMLELGYNPTQLSFLSGDADQWAKQALAKSISVDTTPTLHAIAQSTNQDHVAVVESVNIDGTITVTESSYTTDSSSPWNLLWRHRTCPATWFDNFIHVAPETGNIVVTIASAPSALQVVIDNTSPAQTTPVNLTWLSGATHSLSATTPQYSQNSQTQYVFAAWSTGSPSNAITVAPTTASTYTAYFNQLYLVNVSAGPGGTTSPSGSSFYSPGASVGISATPGAGYSFSGWTGTGTGSYTGSSNAVTLAVNGAISETASFSANPVTYTVSVSASPANGGTASGGGTFASGSPITVTASANNGFTFSNWTENGTLVSTSSAYAFTVATNRNLTANFIPTSPSSGIVALATNLNTPGSIAADGTNVFWTEYNGTGLLKQVARTGGAVTTLATGYSGTYYVALDSTFAYFVGQNASGSAILRVPKGGGTVSTVVSGVSSADGLAVDGTNVFWTEYPGAVREAPVGGGTATTLATGYQYADGIAVDASQVYWTTLNNPGPVWKVAKTGGTVTRLGNNSNTPGIASDGTSVFWSEYVFIGAGKIDECSTAGGSVTSIVTGLSKPWAIAVDANYIYWVENTSAGAVKQIAKWGGTPVTLVGNLNNPSAIALDSTSVYWAEASAIKSVPKATIGPMLGSPIVVPGALSFSVAGPAGSNAVLQYSPDLMNWNSISTSTIPSSGSFITTNSILLNASSMYFREVIH